MNDSAATQLAAQLRKLNDAWTPFVRNSLVEQLAPICVDCEELEDEDGDDAQVISIADRIRRAVDDTVKTVAQ